MAQNWDYAELSKDAKVAGGPESMLKCWSLQAKRQVKWRCCLGLE